MHRGSHEIAPAAVSPAARLPQAGMLFGVPLGDLGWFTSVIMGLAIGFAAFFVATFVAILSFLIYNSAGHHTLNYAWTYVRVGLPVGLVVGLSALAYLGSLWVRRKLRSA